MGQIQQKCSNRVNSSLQASNPFWTLAGDLPKHLQPLSAINHVQVITNLAVYNMSWSVVWLSRTRLSYVKRFYFIYILEEWRPGLKPGTGNPSIWSWTSKKKFKERRDEFLLIAKYSAKVQQNVEFFEISLKLIVLPAWWPATVIATSLGYEPSLGNTKSSSI